jgi:ATP-dependent RNA helicase DHX36
MIVLGIIFRCLDAMMILGSIGTERSVFVNPLGEKGDARNVRRAFSQQSVSDQIAYLNVYRTMRATAAQEGYEAARRIAPQSLINYATFKNTETNTTAIEKVLVDAGLIPHTPPGNRSDNEFGDFSLNENSSNIAVIKALLTAGAPANLAAAVSARRLRTASLSTTVIHPSSIKAVGTKDDDSKLSKNDLFIYTSMINSTDGKSMFLRDVSQISPLTAALFAGGGLRPELGSSPTKKIVKLNNWLPFFVKGAPKAAESLLKCREALDQLLSRTFQDLSKRPKRDMDAEMEATAEEDSATQYLADDPARAFFIDAIVDLLDRDAEKSNKARESKETGEAALMSWYAEAAVATKAG